MLNKIRLFWKKETVLCISALCAVITMFFVTPDRGYIEYIDLHVLFLLFSLMAVVAGFQVCGVFRVLTYRLLRRIHSGRMLGLVLVLLPFFCAMLVTNDVALLVFVPFTIGLLGQMGCRNSVIPMLVFQTIAANLGSMATPVGNPQNLFLYSVFGLTAGEFFSVTLPLTAVSLVWLAVVSLFVLPKKLPEPDLKAETLQAPVKLLIYALLFVLCLLAVFHVVSDWVMLVVVLVAVLIMDRKLLLKVDYALLVTFVCFFIVSGNLGRITAVRVFLQGLLAGSVLLTATGASQIISNVPAAVLLSGFTDQWKPLLEGVNIGGLGTPIASLASLITMKLYLREPDGQAGRFVALFLLANVIGLVLLLGAAAIL